MIRLQDWLAAQEKYTVPLFDTEDDALTVRTHLRGKNRDRLTLTRHPAFDTAMINMVEAGLSDPDWHGFLYVMHTGIIELLIPRYVGKAEKKGVKHEISANLMRIRHSPDKFGRWGYNSAYHFGELSHAVLGEAFKPGLPQKSYGRWREALFAQTSPPILRAPVWIQLMPWYRGSRGPSGLIGSVTAVEYELIALAGMAYQDELLNIQGR
ncbi:hypothetical protein GCM10022631_27450 [Deinococcus rubellus]|uniref:hypothetical protein n=1 Tax=Deinococcus rubellus TaxID=1889240 RepID=UPI0031E95DE8